MALFNVFAPFPVTFNVMVMANFMHCCNAKLNNARLGKFMLNVTLFKEVPFVTIQNFTEKHVSTFKNLAG